MQDFDVEAFVTKLDRMGMKLTAVPLANGKLRVNRWCMLNAAEHAQQIQDLWTTQVGNDQERIDVLAAHLARAASREGADFISSSPLQTGSQSELGTVTAP
jgi:phage terminase large subunit-like protein